ncbi:hypothetical protein GWK47_020840 [Chionoecetes opilio]|uniref:Uncharacterized protein n=1 Tax=Chionoecetes opilio TaxID=41210 RepID=A0A8J5CES2_CHIOP|nr:hypothetical protein GWK47_020840 [Chionoecetes opilio]
MPVIFLPSNAVVLNLGSIEPQGFDPSCLAAMVPMPRNYQPRNILTTDGKPTWRRHLNHRIETGCSIRTACNLLEMLSLGPSRRLMGGRSCLSTRTSRRFSLMGQEHFIEEYSIKISRMFYGCRRELSGGWS